MVKAFCQHVAEPLDELDEDDDGADGVEHDVRAVALVAVSVGDFTEAARAERAGNRRVADKRNQGDGKRVGEPRQRFGQEHFAHDLYGRGAHRLRRFDESGGDFVQHVFHHARDEGRGGEGQRHDGGGVADGDADDGAGEGDDPQREDEVGDGAADVDDDAERVIDVGVRQKAATSCRVEDEAEQGAEDGGDEGRAQGHVEGFAGADEHEPGSVADEGVQPGGEGVPPSADGMPEFEEVIQHSRGFPC